MMLLTDTDEMAPLALIDAELPMPVRLSALIVPLFVTVQLIGAK